MASMAQATIFLGAAKKQLSAGRCKEAAETAKKALAAFGKVGDKQGISDSVKLAITALVDASALDDAVKLADEQLKALASDKKSAAFVKCSKAVVLLAQSKATEALQAATEAQQSFEQLGEAKGVVEAKTLVSKAALLSGNSAVAVAAAEESVKLCIDSKDVPGEASSWAAVMAARFASDSYDKGVSAAKAAAALYGQCGDKKGEAIVLQKCAEACLQAGSANEALSSLSRALDLLDVKTSPNEMASTVSTMVKTYIGLKQPSEAIKVSKKICSMLKRAGAKQASGIAMLAIAEAQAAAGAGDDAVETAQAAAALFKELGSKEFEAAALAQVTKVSTTASEVTSGVQAGEDALVLLKDLGKPTHSMTEALSSLKGKETEIAEKKDEDSKKIEAEVELEKALVHEVGTALMERDEKAFLQGYKKLAGLKYLTEADVNERLAYAWEDDWDTTMRWIEMVVVAGEGTYIKEYSRDFMYFFMRQYGMGYGPQYRLNTAINQHFKPDLMERHSMARLEHHLVHRENDWEPRLGWHAGILDVGLQTSSGLQNMPTGYLMGLEDFDGNPVQAQ